LGNLSLISPFVMPRHGVTLQFYEEAEGYYIPKLNKIK